VSGTPTQSVDHPLAGPVDPDTRARTHLANERTFLAWLRTGLSLIAVGMAAAGLLPVDLVRGVPFVTAFAILLVVSGTAMTMYGAKRYLDTARQIEKGSYDPGVAANVAAATIIALIGILAIPLVLLLR
jgi:putative membrane protein